MELTTKKLARKDFRKIIDFAIEGMNFDHYVKNRIGQLLYGRYFLYLELERSSRVITAYLDDRLVGILMVDLKGEPKIDSSWSRRFYVKTFETLMNLFFKASADQYDQANQELLLAYTKTAEPAGEICFLAVDPLIQGKGIGTYLLTELGIYAAGKLLYLYTDTNCTYQFYEGKGFKRVGEKEIHMELSGKTVPLKCLLYSKYF